MDTKNNKKTDQADDEDELIVEVPEPDEQQEFLQD